MADTLAVELNRDQPYEIDPAAESFETTGSFMLVLKNEGAGRHVNIRMEGALAHNVSLDEGTHFVGSGALWSTSVAVDQLRESAVGTLTISLGYGKETCEIPILIDVPETEPSEADLVKTEEAPRSNSESGPMGRRLRGIPTNLAPIVGIILGSLVLTLLLSTAFSPVGPVISVAVFLVIGVAGLLLYFSVRGGRHERPRRD